MPPPCPAGAKQAAPHRLPRRSAATCTAWWQRWNRRSWRSSEKWCRWVEGWLGGWAAAGGPTARHAACQLGGAGAHLNLSRQQQRELHRYLAPLFWHVQSCVQVAYSLASCAAAAAEWEDGGRAGPQPSYALLPLPQSAASPGMAPGPQHRAAHCAVAAWPGGSLPASGSCGEAAASEHAQQQQEQLPQAAQPAIVQAAAGLQARATTLPPAAPATAAAPSADVATGAATGRLPGAVLHRGQVPQPQAAAGWVANAAQQAVELPAGHQQQQGPGQETGILPSVYAAALAASVQVDNPRSCPPALLNSSNSSSGGSQAAQQPPQRRRGAAVKAPAAVCFACCTGVAQEGEVNPTLPPLPACAAPVCCSAAQLICLCILHEVLKRLFAPPAGATARLPPSVTRRRGSAAVGMHRALPPHLPPQLQAASQWQWLLCTALPGVPGGQVSGAAGWQDWWQRWPRVTVLYQ